MKVPLASTTLIEASAGTGKTYTITTLYLRCLLELPLDVRQILVVTYTKAATAELRDRVRRRIHDAHTALRTRQAGEDATLRRLLEAREERGDLAGDLIRLAQALQDFDEAAIFTIHGFCRRMLQENAFESRVPFESELVGEQELLRDEVARDFIALRLRAAPEYLVRELRRRGLTLARFDHLAKIAGSDRRLPVLPDAVAVPDLDHAYGDWRSALGRVARIWAQSREEVLKLLTDGRRLKATSYRRDHVEKWARALDAVLVAATPEALRTFDSFKKFTSAGLQAGAKDGRPPHHELFTACDDLLARGEALDCALERYAVWLKRDFVEYARTEIRERKEATNSSSFDDLLHRLAEALTDGGGAVLASKIADRFRTALIDEFQDTDPVQYEIFREIYRGRSCPLFLIGDPKQAIYSFRGADIYTYIEARGDAGERRHTLDTNYRSDVALIRAVNALFRRPPRPFLLERIGFEAVRPAVGAADLLGAAAGKPPLEILLVPGTSVTRKWGEDELPRLVAAEIARFLRSGARLGSREVGAGDVAVLCRTNQQAKLTHAELQKLYVPCVLQGDSSVLDTEDAEEVERVLLAMADPADAAALRSALATRLLGLTASELYDLQRSEAAWDARMRQFAELSDSWSTQGFVPAFRRMLERFGVQARLLEQLDGERRLTNVLHVGELLQNAAAESRRGPLALVEWLHRMRHDSTSRADLATEAEQIRLESDAERVKLTTIHQAKGLEYPIVYCPFSWGKLFEKKEDEPIRFHDADDGWRVKLDLGSEAWSAHREQAELEELAESLRLLYVALTRAKHRCSIVWGAFTGSDSSALGYLLHRPSEPLEDPSLEAIRMAIRERSASPQAIRADLERLVRDAEGAVAVVDLMDAPGEPLLRPVAELPRLAPRPLRRPPLDTTWRVSSFSALASGGGRVSEPAEEGIDRDERAEEEAAPEGAAGAAAERIVLWALPRGATAGDLVHEIFEHADFTRATGPPLERVVAAALGRHGFAASWNEVLCRAVREVLSTPLGGDAGELALDAVSPDRRLSEMEFLLPVAQDAAAVDRDRLAAAFRAHWAVAGAADYPEQITRLRFRPLAGFLRGFIDLVFEHDGRWYVVDYKSTFFGARPADYQPSRLLETMARHHFFLQYHLYTLALDRHLRARVPGYDYERSFGGIYYLFVRGMSPRQPRGYGIFHDRPPHALIEELSRTLAPRGRLPWAS
jgi:exodeoxyribonuclease V beta subunit